MAEDFQAPLRQLAKEHDNLVGIDSDGCVFNSMDIKQKEAFAPKMAFDLGFQQVSRYLRDNREFLDLGSKWRGYNRWHTFLMNLDLLEERLNIEGIDFTVPKAELVSKFVKDQDYKLSDSEIVRFTRDITDDAEIWEYLDFVVETFPDLNKHVPSPQEMWKRIDELTDDPELNFLLRAVYWTYDVNREIKSGVCNLPPFEYAKKSLERIAEQADAICVSGTPQEALQREWKQHHIDPYVKAIAGQEAGGKAVHLALANGGDSEGSRYENNKRIMIGDAFGDLKAAITAGALFYPIIAGDEENSWKRFHNEAFKKFLDGEFAGDYQVELIREFFDSLPGTPPWIKGHENPDRIHTPDIPTLRAEEHLYTDIAELKQRAMAHYEGA